MAAAEGFAALLHALEADDPDLIRKEIAPAIGAVDSRLAPDMVQRLVASLCSWLRAHDGEREAVLDETLVHSALKVLGSLLGLDRASDGIALQKGMLSTTTGLLDRFRHNTSVVRSCLDVLASLSVVDTADAVLSRLGTVNLIVDILKHYREDPSILEDAVTTLAVMAKRTRHRRTLSQGGCITVLVDVLKRGAGHPTLVVAVCRFLGNFAVKEDCCLTVLQNGGIDALMAAFDNSVQQQRRPAQGGAQGVAEAALDTRAAVAAAIWTCSTDCNEVQNTLLSVGWLSSLAAVLQAAPDHAALHEAALGIVRNLSRNRQYREDILGLGFVEEATRAMAAFPSNQLLVKEGCGFIGNLATDPDTRAQLGESGVVEVVVEALANCRGHDHRKVAKLALGALSNLAGCGRNRELLGRSETAVPALLSAARTFMQNENILEYAVGAISHLAADPACNKRLIQGGTAEALLIFLGDHREDLQVTLRCVTALRRLLKHAAPSSGGAVGGNLLARQIATAGGPQEGCRGVHILVDAMQEHVYDEGVVREVALLLSSLSVVPSNIPALMQVAVRPCMKALEVHVNDAGASDALAGFMGSLPLEEDDNWAQGDGPAGVVGGGQVALDSPPPAVVVSAGNR